MPGGWTSRNSATAVSQCRCVFAWSVPLPSHAFSLSFLDFSDLLPLAPVCTKDSHSSAQSCHPASRHCDPHGVEADPFDTSWQHWPGAPWHDTCLIPNVRCAHPRVGDIHPRTTSGEFDMRWRLREVAQTKLVYRVPARIQQFAGQTNARQQR